MTKKPSEKNKAWEKDRRDRLNKTFDELAKLLPQFDQSVVWSKIEIIQKAIAFIRELQQKHESYLNGKDPELLTDYKEFINCLEFYQKRNAQLTDLLIKAKVTLPAVALPRLLTDKPELLLNNAEPSLAHKPKRAKNSAKKSDILYKKAEEKEDNASVAVKVSEEITHAFENNQSQTANKLESSSITNTKLSKTTANGQSCLADCGQNSVKPLLLRTKKVNLKRKRNKKPMFRKCYPHPDKMPNWSIDAMALCKIRTKQCQQKLKKNKTKHSKIELNTIPRREQLVSPTAAFLLSFPVVTSLSGKNVENVESSVSLENLNNFFSSEEYNKFCDQGDVADEKMLTSMCIPSEGKAGKPTTSFTVSAITRPSSPTNLRAPFQAKSKQQIQCKAEKKLNENSFDSCCTFTSVTTAGEIKLSNSQKAICTGQLPSSNLDANAGCSNSTDHLKQLAKDDLLVVNCFQTEPNSTVKLHSNYLISSAVKTPAMTTTTMSLAKPLVESAPMLSSMLQSSPIHSETTTAMNWTKPITHSKYVAQNQISCIGIGKNNGPTKHIEPKSLSIISTDAINKSSSKQAIPFYSPTKSLFHDFSLQTPIKTFNFNMPTSTTSSISDPLTFSPITAKAHSFFSFPSMKTEFPWLTPNSNSSPIALVSSTNSVSTCSMNFPPLDLPPITGESLHSTSVTFSFCSSKSAEPSVVDTENKLNAANNAKCGQMNLFIPYEEMPCASTHISSLKKTSSNQSSSTANWKPEKVKDSSNQFFYDCEQSKPQPKSLVNWMTSPTIEYTPPSNTGDFSNQFSTSTNVDFGFGCRKDTCDEDNHFINWSPLKNLNSDFSTSYSFENFGSNEAPPNKTVKQIFSVSQLVDQTPSQEIAAIKKAEPKAIPHKSTPVKQSFSNTYTAESLIAKKDSPRITNAGSLYNSDILNTQTDYSYFYNNYSNAPHGVQTENEYLGVNSYSASNIAKTTSALPSTGGMATTNAATTFDSTTSSTNTYFGQLSANSVNINDPYDPIYFPSANFNQSTTPNWNHSTKITSANGFTQGQLPFAGVYGNFESSCQQSTNGTGNLTNFNLSSICPEIDGKDAANAW